MSTSYAWDVYAESLTYLGYGYPLWCPDTWNQRRPWDMEIGDVGWLRDGQFRPLIRTTTTDEAQQPYHKVPPGFVPFDTAGAGIGGNPDKIMQRVLHSRKIKATSISAGLSASAPNPAQLDVGGSIAFKCTEDRAGLLVLNPRGEETVIDSAGLVINYLRANHTKWIDFANDPNGLGLGLKMEDIIFVSGVIKTANWGVAAFLSGQHETSGSLSCSFGRVGSANISLSLTNVCTGGHWERAGPSASWRALSCLSTVPSTSSPASSPGPLPPAGASLQIHDTSSAGTSVNSDPRTSLSTADSFEGGVSPTNLASSLLSASSPKVDQCIFFHYYKVKRRGILMLSPQFELKAGAGPHELPRDPGGPEAHSQVLSDDMDIMEDEQAVDSFEVIPSNNSQQFDPVNAALDYILENSDAQIAIASDTDLYALFEHEDYPHDIVRALTERHPLVVVDNSGVGHILCNLPPMAHHATDLSNDHPNAYPNSDMFEDFTDVAHDKIPRFVQQHPARPHAYHGGSQDVRGEMGASGSSSGYMDKGSNMHTSEDVIEVASSALPEYFQERGGRLYPRDCYPYPLPVDAEEQQRLNGLSALVRRLIGDSCIRPVRDLLALASDHDEQRRVVDLGTGTGQWVLDMAREFPHVHFYGLDIVPIATRYPPPNVTFEMHDIMTPLRYATDSIDVVHARFITMAVRDYRALIQEVSRVLRHRGLFVWCEWSQLLTMETGSHVRPYTPSTHAFFNAVRETLRVRCGLEFGVRERHIRAYLLESRQFRTVDTHVLRVPIGDWPNEPDRKELGRDLLELMVLYAQSVLPLLSEGPSAEYASTLVEDYIREIRSIRGMMTSYHIVYARKAPPF